MEFLPPFCLFSCRCAAWGGLLNTVCAYAVRKGPEVRGQTGEGAEVWWMTRKRCTEREGRDMIARVLKILKFVQAAGRQVVPMKDIGVMILRMLK